MSKTGSQLRENRDTLLHMNQVIGKQRYGILTLTLLSALGSLITLLYAWLFRSLIDAAVAGDGAGVGRAVLWLLLALAGQIGLRALERHLEENCRSGIENRLKSRLFRCLLRGDYAQVAAVHSGEWMNRLTNDTRIVAENAVLILPGLTGMLIRLVGAIVLLLVLQPGFAVVLVPGGLLLIAVTFAFRRRLKTMHQEIQESDGRLRVFLQERLGSLMVLRAFGKEAATVKAAERRMQEHRNARMKRNAFSNLCNIGFGAVMSGAYIGSAIYCAYGILHGRMSFGTMTAILQLVSQVQSPFANLSGFLPKYYAMLGSAERIFEAERFAEEQGIQERSPEEIQAFYEEKFRALVLEDVSFRYPDRETEESEAVQTVLSHCSLRFEKGKTIGIRGLSGVGKSTLFKLLMAFYRPEEGQLMLETGDGERLPLDASWRGLFAYVPQGNHLMHGSIREAVTFGEAEYDGQKLMIREALHIACADGFVEALPAGTETELGEHGAGLSEGQLQRLAIARAIYSGRPILLLDEATSALDEETERELLARIRKQTEQTVLIITHRPAALEIADSVVSFEAGEKETWEARAENEAKSLLA